MDISTLIPFVVTAIVALGLGWLLGMSGRRNAERLLRVTALQQELNEGRCALLEARLDLFNVNFGEATRHLEMSHIHLRIAADQLKVLERKDDMSRMQLALAGVDDAKRMAVNLDKNANIRTAEAAKIVGDLIAARVAVARAR